MTADRVEPTPAAAPGRDRAGRILRVKLGYNPNSSSMGSIVFALPVALLGASALFGAAAAAIFAGLIGGRDGSAAGPPAGEGAKPAGEAPRR
jgi:hypothetical protein